MSSNRVLVTGGAGYIGSHTCKALVRAGYAPVVYDNLVNGHEWAVRWGPLEIGDIANRAQLDQVIVKYKPSAVMHLAAHAPSILTGLLIFIISMKLLMPM